MKRRLARSPELIDFARDQRSSSNEFAATVWHWIRNLRFFDYAVIREDGDLINKIREFVRASGNEKNPSPPAPLPERGEGERRSEAKITWP